MYTYKNNFYPKRLNLILLFTLIHLLSAAAIIYPKLNFFKIIIRYWYACLYLGGKLGGAAIALNCTS